ncbi:MAG: hypothetical protein LWY06_00515 [Firmicutes bacterium]|nr:hypothetical protein [Bacillota bacterium]
METHIGLTPEEMISVFNRMYLDVWEKTKNNINWELAKITTQAKEEKDVDISRLLLEVLEVVITATRDGFVVAMYENNEKIYNDLRMAAIKQAEAMGALAEGEELEEEEESRGPLDINNV